MLKSPYQPIQRVCRYPLLFAELHKNSPALDDSDSEVVIYRVFRHLQQKAQEINKATNDPQARARIEQTWQLQELLLSSDLVSVRSLTKHRN